MRFKCIAWLLILLVVSGICNTEVVCAGPEDLVPQPTYSVGLGLELEKLENTAKQILCLLDIFEGISSQIDSLKNQSEFLRAMFGSSKILNLDFSFVDWTHRDWLEFVAFDLDKFFAGVDRLIEKPVAITLTKDQVKLIDNFKNIVGSNYKNVPQRKENETVQEKKSRIEGMYGDLNRKIGYLNNMQDEGIKKYVSQFVNLQDTKDDLVNEIIPGSVPCFIKKQQEALVTIDENMLTDNNLSIANMPLLLKSMNQLLLQNNQLTLKVVEVLADFNAYNLIVNPLNSNESLSEEFEKIHSEEWFGW